MRILPPVLYTVRVVQQPLKVGPFEVPRETRVIASHYLTHHLPDLYPEPERFRLERWRNINPSNMNICRSTPALASALAGPSLLRS